MLLSALRLTGEEGPDSSVPRYEDRNGGGGGGGGMFSGGGGLTGGRELCSAERFVDRVNQRSTDSSLPMGERTRVVREPDAIHG